MYTPGIPYVHPYVHPMVHHCTSYGTPLYTYGHLLVYTSGIPPGLYLRDTSWYTLPGIHRVYTTLVYSTLPGTLCASSLPPSPQFMSEHGPVARRRGPGL